MNFNTSGNRDEWTFPYTAIKLAEGATAQRDFRLSRVEWWSTAKESVMAEIREKGVTVSESIAANLANYSNSTQAIGPQVTINADLQRKLAECHSKIEAHRRAAAEYDGWVQVLTANPESRLDLTQGDWLYFFGKV